jgi:phycocyanobilin lyase beta subunit
MSEELIRAVTLAETPAQMVKAVQNLAAAKVVSAIPTLIAVFGYNNPAAALVAVNALIEFGEIAVPQLLSQIDDYNYGARSYSIRTLAAIADPRALDVLITAAATDFAPSVRCAAAKGLGRLHWHKLSDSASIIAIERTLDTLLLISQDAEWSIRYAAIVGLESLAKITDVQQSIRARLEEILVTDPEIAIRARAQLASNDRK